MSLVATVDVCISSLRFTTKIHSPLPLQVGRLYLLACFLIRPIDERVHLFDSIPWIGCYEHKRKRRPFVFAISNVSFCASLGLNLHIASKLHKLDASQVKIVRNY